MIWGYDLNPDKPSLQRLCKSGSPQNKVFVISQINHIAALFQAFITFFFFFFAFRHVASSNASGLLFVAFLFVFVQVSHELAWNYEAGFIFF